MNNINKIKDWNEGAKGSLFNNNIKRPWIHIGFCIIVFALSFAAISIYTANLDTGEYTIGSGSDYAIKLRISKINSHALELGTSICTFFLLCVYIGRWLCRKWYLKNKIKKFLLLLLIFCFFLTLLGGLLVQYLFHPVNMHLMAYLLNISPFIILSVITGVFIKLIRASLKNQIQNITAEATQKQSELKMLQSQISPHFLFNTLNNLYGLSLTQQDRLPKLLLKLSDLLRYSVYDIKKSFVSLSEELEYIKNYIDFEKIGLGERLILNCSLETVIDKEIRIAPMILIVFIENAFKHSINSMREKIFIDMSLKISDDQIFFSIKNTYIEQTGKDIIISGETGIGLDNTIKRLKLLYEKQYEYVQKIDKGYYVVDLKLKIK